VDDQGHATGGGRLDRGPTRGIPNSKPLAIHALCTGDVHSGPLVGWSQVAYVNPPPGVDWTDTEGGQGLLVTDIDSGIYFRPEVCLSTVLTCPNLCRPTTPHDVSSARNTAGRRQHPNRCRGATV
jgi:hypothetical protein